MARSPVTRSTRPSRPAADGTPRAPGAVDVSGLGGREPCPCGSGRRVKACHGRADHRGPAFVARPFEGLAGEADWVALAELVPAATAPLRLRTPDGERDATLATILPLGWPAMARSDGGVFVAAQGTGGSGDASAALAVSLLDACAAPAGTPVPRVGLPGLGAPRLQDVLVDTGPLAVTVHDGFGFWVEGVAEADDEEVAASLERASAATVPTVRLASVTAAYWGRLAGRDSLRWVLDGPEEPTLDALARLHGGGGLPLRPGDRFIGTVRAHGLLVAVWDLPERTEAEQLEDPAAAFAARLGDALAAGAPLSDEQRHARAGLTTRQITLR